MRVRHHSEKNAVCNRNKDEYAVVYIAAEFPHARGVKWVRSLAAAGLKPFVAFGRGRENLWAANGIDEEWMLHDPRLRKKLHFGAGTAVRIHSALVAVNAAPKAILVRDVFLTPVARQLSKLAGCPWVLDLCDNYPEVAGQNQELRRPWIRLGAPYIQALEARSVREARATVFVSPESRSLVLRKLGGRHDNPTFTVENAPWIDGSPNAPLKTQAGKDLVYLGTVDSNIRDFGTVVRGLDAYRTEYGEHICVDVLTFDQSKAEQQLDRTGTEWRTFIRLKPPVPAQKLPETLPGYLGGLVPHYAGPAVDYTISNKIFDYLSAGTPVVASDNPPNVRLLERVGGGITYRRESPDSFAEALRALRIHGVRAADYDLLEKEYTWQRQAAEVIAFLASL